MSTAWPVMIDSPRAVVSDRRARWLALAALTVAVVAMRRPDQFMHPHLWVEDGAVNLPEYLVHGWGMLIQPIAGYFILPVKLIFASAASLSFRALPEISLVFTLMFTFCVVAAIAFSPTRLRHRYACAIAVLLVPCDPEVFGIGLYTGWWGSLLAILPLLWRNPEERSWLRHVYVVIGGLSTPLIMGLAPLYLLRAAVTRHRSDVLLAVTCLAVTSLQLWALWSANRMPDAAGDANTIMPVITKFFGYYLYRPSTAILGDPAAWSGSLLLLVLASGLTLVPRAERWAYLLLLCSLAIAIVSSIVRIPVGALDPVIAGPRYFFFPFVLVSWCLLQLVRKEHRVASSVALLALLLPAYNLVAYGSRGNVHYDWRSEVATCVASANAHRFPIHYDGKGDANTWGVRVSRDDCRRLVRSSIFDDQLSD